MAKAARPIQLSLPDRSPANDATVLQEVRGSLVTLAERDDCPESIAEALLRIVSHIETSRR